MTKPNTMKSDAHWYKRLDEVCLDVFVAEIQADAIASVQAVSDEDVEFVRMAIKFIGDDDGMLTKVNAALNRILAARGEVR